MADQLNVTVDLRGVEAVQRRLAALGPQLHTALRAAVERETVKLQAHVVADKLSGQVLNVRTGTLRRSITYTVRDEGTRIVGTVGTNVEYARIHEYGGTIQVPEIRPRHAKALHWMSGGRDVFAMRARAHPVTMPERSFLRSALAERRPIIVAALQAAASGVLKGAPGVA